jgi:hypothetical protein
MAVTATVVPIGLLNVSCNDLKRLALRRDSVTKWVVIIPVKRSKMVVI